MEQLTVQILEREYRLSCEPSERATLLAAVERVDASMRTIREQGRITGTERIAVFAALNIAGEFLAHEVQTSTSGTVVHGPLAASPGVEVADPEILRRMQSINALLDTALASQERLF